MNKLQRLAMVVLRLAFVAANLPIPVALHAQLPQQNSKAEASMSVEQMRAFAERMRAFDKQAVEKQAVATEAVDRAAPVAPAPKQPGTVRIGVVLPANHLDGKSQLSDGEPLRAAEIKLLSGPKLEAVALKAVLPAQAEEEAALLTCDYVLTSSVAQQKVETQSRFGKLGSLRTLQLATTAAQFVPRVGMTAMMTSALVSTAAAQTVSQSLNGFTHNVKANSDVMLEYTLTGKAGATILSGTEKARSQAEGEDVLTGLLSTAAGKIANAAKP